VGEERLFAKVMHLAKELKPLMSKMRPSTKFEGASKGTCVEGWSQKACSKVDGWSDSDIAFEDGEDTD
jgi:hypothetical protein